MTEVIVIVRSAIRGRAPVEHGHPEHGSHTIETSRGDTKMKHSHFCHRVIGSDEEQSLVKLRGPTARPSIEHDGSSETKPPCDATYRRLAWARMYLDFGDLELAVACFRSATTSASPCERELHQREALELAGRLADALGIAERVDAAGRVLSSALTWAHGRSMAETPAGSDSTVVANDRSIPMASIGMRAPYGEEPMLMRSRPFAAA